jgi:hypothetical protein
MTPIRFDDHWPFQSHLNSEPDAPATSGLSRIENHFFQALLHAIASDSLVPDRSHRVVPGRVRLQSRARQRGEPGH